MQKPSPALLLVLALFLLPAIPASNTSASNNFPEKPPLTVDFVVDPELLKRLPRENIEKKLKEAVQQASPIFLFQIGKKIETGKISFDEKLPKEINKQSFLAKEVLDWLEKSAKTADFIVFVSGRVIKSAAGEAKGGFANMKKNEYGNYVKSGESIILFYSDAKIMRQLMLHELGHNCGAIHIDEDKTVPNGEKIESLMHSKMTSDLKYDPKSIDIIKQNCG